MNAKITNSKKFLSLICVFSMFLSLFAPSFKADPTPIKVVFVGDEMSGKTGIINRFICDDFNRNCETTIGVDYFTKTIRADDTDVSLQIWDTAGQERFRSLIPSYIRYASCVAITFDLREEFSKVQGQIDRWVEIVKNNNPDAQIFLVGNKSDLGVNVDEEAIEGFAQENSFIYMRTSAKTGEGVNELFQAMAKEGLRKVSGESKRDDTGETSDKSAKLTTEESTSSAKGKTTSRSKIVKYVGIPAAAITFITFLYKKLTGNSKKTISKKDDKKQNFDKSGANKKTSLKQLRKN